MLVKRAAVTLTILAATGLLVAGCSKPGPAPADQALSPAAPPSGTFGSATAPGPGKIRLDVKVNGDQAVYGDPSAGRGVFSQCLSCHAIEAGVNKVGPSLHGIVGRRAGSVADFHYSSANKGSGLVWSEQELYAYLENPQKIVPGTYMTYTGVKDPQKRADVIAYLQENAR